MAHWGVALPFWSGGETLCHHLDRRELLCGGAHPVAVNARSESDRVRDLIGDGLRLCRVLEMAFREHSGC
jgi:hypothetical protein